MKKESVISFLPKKEIEKIIDPIASGVIFYLLKKIAFSQPEILKTEDIRGMQMTKEFLEACISQACNLNKIGSGSYPIDVYSEKQYGADIKFVTSKIDKDGNFNSYTSGETSLGQNFSDDEESTLDELFKNKLSQKILKKWSKILESKYEKPIKEFKLKNIYYFIFVRGDNKIFLSIARVNKNNIKNLTTNKLTEKSLFIDNFIEEKYGNSKIYKSKKRMELRVNPKNLQKDNLFISWDFNDLKPSVSNLRKISENKELEKHLKNELKRFFNL